MDEARIRSAAGFAMRAGCCVSGDFACEKTVKSGRAQFVLLDAGASDATLERYRGMVPAGRHSMGCADGYGKRHREIWPQGCGRYG